jgi:predicted dehydrogenase
MAPPVNRRDFLKAGAVVSSFFIVPRHVLGGPGFLAPSDKITLGFIGCGRQGVGLHRNFQKIPETQVIAGSDVYAAKLNSFVQTNNQLYAQQTGETGYKTTSAHVDFRELLNRKDIDAVVIAVPDHWHAAVAVRAAGAGKDIYCEKPLSLTIPEGRAMVKATRKHERVFQTGSMQRSWKEFTQAVQLVRSGAIGTVKHVNISVGGPPRDWDLSAEPLPTGLNWGLWMGPNEIERPYNNALAPALDATFWGKWRDYREFGGGGMTDWGAHMFDIAQWGLNMDQSGPTEVIPPGGNKGEGLIYKYANGVTMTHQPVAGKNFCQFIGTNGEVLVGRGELKTTPAGLADKTFQPSEYSFQTSTNHYQDFLTAIKTRKPPICDVEVGHRTASVCTIGNMAYRLQRPLRWNPEKERFEKDAEANKLLSRPMKKEWNV